MSRASFFFLMVGMVGLLALNACGPFGAQPTGPSAEEIRAQVATSVAQTLSAMQTEQAARPSPTSTFTATPTSSPTPFPTLSPFPPTMTLAARTPYAYACTVIGKVPYDNFVFKPNTGFDIKFSLQNVGTKKWDAGADLRYSGGTKMLTANTVYELPEVGPGETVGPFVFDAKSPKKAGTYTMTFKVQGGFCYPYVRIIVKP